MFAFVFLELILFEGPAQGPPYAPTAAGLGGLPTVKLDVPITAVFMFLFILGAAAHMTIFQLNRKRGHKFIISALMFGFSLSRVLTCILRIVWATKPTSVRIAIAAQVFVSAGVVLLFVINAIFAQRIVRASHPHTGWHPVFHYFFIATYVIIVLSLIMLVTASVQSFFTLNPHTRRIDHDIILYGQTFYVFVSFLPILLVVGGLIIPRKVRVEKFGSGRFRTKIAILLFASVLLCLGASFRTGINYESPRPMNDPAWYHSKACFYLFNFTLEIIVILLYVVVRVDQRFYIRDGSKGMGDYTREKHPEHREEASFANRILSEEETFDEEDPGATKLRR